MEFSNTQTETPTRVTSRTEKDTVSVLEKMLMEVSFKGIILTINLMDRGFISGWMGSNMMEIGKMASSQAKESR